MGRPVQDDHQIVEEPSPPPPPKEIGEEREKVTAPSPSYGEEAYTKVEDVDFGRSINSRHKELLYLSGVITLKDVVDAGRDGLTSIHGIGDAVATTLLDYVESELE